VLCRAHISGLHARCLYRVNGFFDSTRPNIRLHAASRSKRFESSPPVGGACRDALVPVDAGARTLGAAAVLFVVLRSAIFDLPRMMTTLR
jgi:hypothetical protein